MSRLGNFRRRIFNLTVMLSNTVGVLSAVLTILAFLGLSTAVFGYVIHILPLIFIGFGVVTFSILLFIFFYTLLEEKAKTTVATTISLPSTSDTRVYPPPPPEDVEILRKEIVYEYLPDGKTIYQRKHLQIQALRNSLTHFKDRYRWTGRGKCSVRSLTPGFKITNQHKEEEEIWEYFDVSFPYPLHKDDIVEFTIEWELLDEESIAVSFLSTMIDRETRYLLLQVNLPPELAPKRAHFHEYANYIDTLPERTQPVQWSPATKSISYEVLQPKKYRKYLIRWYNQ